MARTNPTANNTNANKTDCYATAKFRGKVVDYYNEGKKYDYVTIDVPHGYDEYYDRFKIAVNKSWPCPDNGVTVEIECVAKCYKGNVSFKDINADNPN